MSTSWILKAAMAVRSGFDFAVDLAMPEHCAGCGRPTAGDRYGICVSCAGIIRAPENACTVCGGETHGGECAVCSGRTWHIGRNIAVTEYSGVMKKIYRAYKFGGRKRLHVSLSLMAAARLRESGMLFDVITWVPMNRTKTWKRGYNQSEIIARSLAQCTGKPCAELLKEVGNRSSQRELGRRGRFINALGRYKTINTKFIRSATVLLVDDVFTTGATINECARMLRMSDAAEVFSLTIARAGIKKLEMI